MFPWQQASGHSYKTDSAWASSAPLFGMTFILMSNSYC